MAEQDDAMIAALSAQQLGAAPAPNGQPAPVPAGPPMGAAPMGAPAGPPPESPPTIGEQAQEKLAPETEGDRQQEEAFIQVDMGDGRKQTMSSSQIAGMSNRYKDLNHKNATRFKPMEPALQLIENVMANAKQAGHDVSGDDMAQFLQASIEAYTKNPVMGDQKDVTPDRPDRSQAAMEAEDELSAWENANAVKLPPMYRQGMQLINQLQGENGQMREMMQGLIAQAQGVSEEAGQALNTANNRSNDAYKQQAVNNLNQMQQSLGFPDDADNDFFNFAYGRGYTEDDFLDPELTMKIGQDFAANRSQPEMERLRALNERRQAFTGSVSPMPSGGGAGGMKSSPDQGFMDAVTAQAMQKRGLA